MFRFQKMTEKKCNAQEYNILEPTKSQRQLRHKAIFPEYFNDDQEKENKKRKKVRF